MGISQDEGQFQPAASAVYSAIKTGFSQLKKQP
jgi:hypothetical protein